VPITITNLWFNTTSIPIYPWISWEDTHFNYSFVGQYPSFEWRANASLATALEFTRWTPVFATFIFFLFFGFAEEARKHYRLAYSFASSRLRLPEIGSSRASSSSPNSPASSFGPGLKKGMATLFSFKDGFSGLGSDDTMIERKASSALSDHRLTSDISIFEGIDNEPKIIGDDARLGSSRQSIVVAMPAIPPVPVLPPPIADTARPPIPPGRLNSPLPHRPTSSYLDIPEDV
jgi:hypothetical protein